jgi:hypothetical protein
MKNMTTNSSKGVVAELERKRTILVTSDMVIDTYLAAKGEKDKKKKAEMMENVIFLSQNLNHYTPLRRSQYVGADPK